MRVNEHFYITQQLGILMRFKLNLLEEIDRFGLNVLACFEIIKNILKSP